MIAKKGWGSFVETKNRIIEEYKKLVKEKKTAIPPAPVTSAVLPLRLIISERGLPSIHLGTLSQPRS